MDIQPVIGKMAVLVLLMLVGYVCAKLGLTGPVFNKHVTPVVLNVLLVSTIFNSVISMEETVSGAVLLRHFAAQTAMMLLALVVAWLFARFLRRDREDEGVLRMLLMFPNNAFVGFPVVASVFGAQAVFYAAISNIPFNVLLYTVGTAQLRRTEGGGFQWKRIFTPPLIATLLSAALYLLRVQVPPVVGDTVSMLAGATIPMSMLVVGTSLGGIPLRRAFGSVRIYLATAVRLFLVPLAVWAVLHLFITDPVMLGIPVLLAACPSAMIITALCIRYGKDEALASEVIFTSTVFSAVTIPLVVYLLF